jgi:transposase-like protein
MTRAKRRKFTAEEKVGILRRHLLEQEPISKVCDESGIHPTQFYRWQQEFFEHGTAAFERPRANAGRKETRRVEELEAKLQKKDSVIAEIMADLILQKKRNGEI